MMFSPANLCNYAIIAVYLGAVVAIGFRFCKEDRSTEQYLMGGRNVPFLAVGISCMMSLLSSISIVNVTGEIINHGMMLFWAMPLTQMLSVPAYLVFTRFYFKLGSCTPYEYLEYRYDKSVRLLVAVCSFYARVMYVGMVLYTTAKIFQGAYGWPAWFSILLVGVCGVVYTVLGGLKAVIWTDVLQFFVLAVGIAAIFVAFYVCIRGGLPEAVACTFREGHGFNGFADPDFYRLTPYVRLLFWLQLWNACTGPFSSACSDQITIQRLLATTDWKAGFKSQCCSAALSIGVCLALLLIGCCCFAYYHQNPSEVVAREGGDVAFFHFIATRLPPPLPGLFMAALLAAIMSTLDSGMNSMATVWLKEFHVRFLQRNLTEEQQVRVSKWATGIVGVFAIGLGLLLNVSGKWLAQSVAEVGTLFWILNQATFPAFLCGVLTRSCSSRMVWGYTFFVFGEQLAWNLWYILSRRAVMDFIQGRSVDLGWGGPLPAACVLVPLAMGAALFAAPRLAKSRRWPWRVAEAAGLSILGVALVMAIWFIYSHTGDVTLPRERSFAFHLPVSLIGFVILACCQRNQPREQYQGLTLSTIDEPILARRM